MKLLRRSLVLTSLVAVTACGSAGGSGQSGLHGLVTRSPITPVCMIGTPCSAPAKNLTIVFSRPGHTVQTRTDARGLYRVTLAAATWHVRTAQPVGIGSGIEPSTVRVVAGVYRRVNFNIDTGIR